MSALGQKQTRPERPATTAPRQEGPVSDAAPRSPPWQQGAISRGYAATRSIITGTGRHTVLQTGECIWA